MEEEERKRREEEERKKREEEEEELQRIDDEIERERIQLLEKRKQIEERLRRTEECKPKLPSLQQVIQQQQEEEETAKNEALSHNLDILEADEVSPTSPNSRLSYTSQQLLNIRNYIHSINSKYNELEVFSETDNEDDDLVSLEFVALYVVKYTAAINLFYLLVVCSKMNCLYGFFLFFMILCVARGSEDNAVYHKTVYVGICVDNMISSWTKGKALHFGSMVQIHLRIYGSFRSSWFLPTWKNTPIW